MSLNPQFESEQSQRLKSGKILLIIGVLMSAVGGPVGLLLCLIALWRVGTSVTDLQAGQWKVLLTLCILAVICSAVWSGFYLDWVFRFFNIGGASIQQFSEYGWG